MRKTLWILPNLPAKYMGERETWRVRTFWDKRIRVQCCITLWTRDGQSMKMVWRHHGYLWLNPLIHAVLSSHAVHWGIPCSPHGLEVFQDLLPKRWLPSAPSISTLTTATMTLKHKCIFLQNFMDSYLLGYELYIQKYNTTEHLSECTTCEDE